MGYTADYDFDFVNEASALTMQVGDDTLPAEKIEDNHYGFGPNEDGSYQYELTYTPSDGAAEHFTWNINVPVSNFAPVQLTYKVELTNPSEESGTYGEYDQYGENGKAGLFTNNSATLYPVDSNGNKADPVDFLKPTVSYEIAKTYTVIYDDGVSDAVVFADDVHPGLPEGVATPGFIDGTPKRIGYIFTGWSPAVQDTVTGDITYYAQWKPISRPVTPPGGDVVIPDEDTPIADLNKEDHFAYVVGYPVDYIIGEKTDGQTRMPVRPEGNITRAEVSTIFFRLLTDESRSKIWSQENDYSDMAAGQWFNAAISTLSNGEIITGYPSGGFKPNGKITRAEFATIAVRFLGGHYEGQDKFSDISGHWAQDNINLAAALGLINGYPDGTFGPDKFITRAEAMTLVNRVLDRHPDAEHMLVWPDNMDTTKWYYEAVQEATNSHKYEMLTDKEDEKNTMENWIELLPVRDWPAFEKAWADANAAINPGEVMH